MFPPPCWSIPEGTIWAFFVTCGVLRVRFFSCFPERCPYRSIDWTCMSKKDENRLYRSTDWTYESTLAVDKRKIVSGGGWKGPSGHQKRPLAAVFFACPERGSNPHVFKGHWILSPARLPIPPSGQGMVSGRDGLQMYLKNGELPNFSSIFVFL